MPSAKSVAAYFILKSESMGDGNKEFSGNNDLTNLKLQKLLHFAQIEHLKQYGTPLFKDKIEAWQYGPVVPTIYKWLKHCQGYVITEFDIDISPADDLSDEDVSFLDAFWKKYRDYSAWKLVEKTHEDGSPWSEIYKGGYGNKKEIPVEMLTGDNLAIAG